MYLLEDNILDSLDFSVYFRWNKSRVKYELILVFKNPEIREIKLELIIPVLHNFKNEPGVLEYSSDFYGSYCEIFLVFVVDNIPDCYLHSRYKDSNFSRTKPSSEPILLIAILNGGKKEVYNVDDEILRILNFK